MTPEDYRAAADPCFRGMHDAQTADERKKCMNIARAWLDAASAEEGERLTRPLTHRLRVIRMLELEYRFNQSLRFMIPAGNNPGMAITSSVGGI